LMAEMIMMRGSFTTLACYILDPKEVHGEDFPGETFRVLKEKEVRLYGEYRTRRLVLEAWDDTRIKDELWRLK